MANSSLTASLQGSLKIKGADAVEMNTVTGEIIGYPNSIDGEYTSLSFDLPPAGSLLLYIPDTKQENLSGQASQQKPEIVSSLSPCEGYKG